MKTLRGSRSLGVFLFALGLVAGIALAALAVWGDLEASLFDPATDAEESLRSFSCPVFITRDETGVVSARFRNTGTQPVERAIRVHISQGHVTLMREEKVQAPIAAGASERLSWPVTAEDAAYGHLILVRVSTLRQFPLPSQTGSCGIVVLDITFLNGVLALIAWLTVSLGAMAGGAYLWWTGQPSSPGRSRGALLMAALGGVVTAGLAVSMMGWWLAGVLLLALTVLMLVAVFAQSMRAN